MKRPGWLIPCLALIALGLVALCVVAAGLLLFRQPLQAWLNPPTSLAVVPPPAIVQPSLTMPAQLATIPVAPAVATAIPPTATNPAPLPTNTPDFPQASFQGISFRYHPGLARTVFPMQVEAANEPGYVMPALYEFDFGGYVHPGSMFSPVISIIPVQDYRALDPGADAQIPLLESLLAQGRPDPSQPLPLLPEMLAAQLIRARVEVIPFQNGSGVRYLTQLAQDAWPINNEDLFYTFQGLTRDGAWYVSAFFPVGHPDLPESGADYPIDDWLQFSENFAGYAEDITQNLNQADSASFTPDLTLLDEVIRSLQALP